MNSGATSRRWTRIEQRLSALYRCRADIGSVPPQPPTMRGSAGRLVMLFGRRALFWLLPQLDRFHACTIELAQEELNALEELGLAYERVDAAIGRTLAEFARRQRDLQDEVAALRAEVRDLTVTPRNGQD